MFCSASGTAPAVLVVSCGLWRSLAGVEVAGWAAPVFTSDPFPKAWMAFSGGQKEELRSADEDEFRLR